MLGFSPIPSPLWCYVIPELSCLITPYSLASHRGDLWIINYSEHSRTVCIRSEQGKKHFTLSKLMELEWLHRYIMPSNGEDSCDINSLRAVLHKDSPVCKYLLELIFLSSNKLFSRPWFIYWLSWYKITLIIIINNSILGDFREFIGITVYL